MITNELLTSLGMPKAELIHNYMGGNSEVSHVRFNKLDFAIKQYKGDATRKARSLLHETSALTFISKHELFNCPKLFSISNEEFAISYRWIPGVVSDNSPEARNFILNTINQLSLNESLVPNYKLNAIDAVLKPFDLLNQLKDRWARLPKINNFPKILMNSINAELLQVTDILASHLDYETKMLSLSDFGTHNLIKSDLNELIHIDFEFFGIDSKAKLYADLFAHPRNSFSSMELRSNLDSIEKSARLESEIMGMLPGIAVKWAFIVLRRYIDWESNIFRDNSQTSVRPDQYLEYAKFLRKLRFFEDVITFKEFQSL